MLTDSGYLKSARLAGSALIIATTAFIWTAVLYPPIWLRYGEMLVFALFACFLANEAVKRIAARCLLLSLIMAILATVASVIVSILVCLPTI